MPALLYLSVVGVASSVGVVRDPVHDRDRPGAAAPES
jgi:hypothetical protein